MSPSFNMGILYTFFLISWTFLRVFRPFITFSDPRAAIALRVS